jgi:hypothetical protein
MPTQNALNLRKYRAEATKAGICTRCFTIKPNRTKSVCLNCREEKEKARKDRVAKYKSQGLCPCGRKPPKNFKTCSVCRKKLAERNKRYRLKKKTGRINYE